MDTKDLIFNLITKKGLKQSDFASSINVKEQVVSDWKAGRTDDPLPKIQIQDTIMAKGDYVGPVNPAEKEWLESVLAAYREKIKQDGEKK